MIWARGSQGGRRESVELPRWEQLGRGQKIGCCHCGAVSGEQMSLERKLGSVTGIATREKLGFEITAVGCLWRALGGGS